MAIRSNKIVSAIVVTIGEGGYWKNCLDSLKTQRHPDLEIIVIDNSRNTELSREAAKAYPSVKWQANRDALSYCASLNMGILLSSGDFILCLNDDVVLDKSFVAEALKGFSRDAKIGMVSGKILRPDAKTLDSTGLFPSFARTPRERGYGLKDKGQFDHGGYIFGVNGAAAFYKKEMLENVKEGPDYFDSRFRFFYEDLDVAWRAQRAGWFAYYIPSAIAYHVRGASVRSRPGIGRPFARRFLSEELHLDLIKNRYLTLIKNESCLGFLGHLPGILLYELVLWSGLLIFKPRLVKMFISRIKCPKISSNQGGRDEIN